MAARPKERKLKETLTALAKRDLGNDMTSTDWVVSKIESGVTVTALAKVLEVEMGESCSRGWVSSVLNRLSPDAKMRIQEARKEAAGVLIDEALSITDEPVGSTADVQRNRMRADTRMRIAGWWDRESYGDSKAALVELSFGALHLDALRKRNAESLRIRATTQPALDAGSPDVELVPHVTRALLAGADNSAEEPLADEGNG